MDSARRLAGTAATRDRTTAVRAGGKRQPQPNGEVWQGNVGELLTELFAGVLHQPLLESNIK
jgi:hypothetical protein